MKTQKYLFKTTFISFLVLLSIGVVISQIYFIPTWEKTQEIIVIISFSLSVFFGLVFFIKSFTAKIYSKKKLSIKYWIIFIFISIMAIITNVGIILYSGLTLGQGFFGPSFVKEYKFKTLTIYQYENSCFPPDNVCECKDYYSLIYVKNDFLPIMRLKKKVDFYIGHIQLKNNLLIIRASDLCKRDLKKEIKIMLN